MMMCDHFDRKKQDIYKLCRTSTQVLSCFSNNDLFFLCRVPVALLNDRKLPGKGRKVRLSNNLLKLKWMLKTKAMIKRYSPREGNFQPF